MHLFSLRLESTIWAPQSNSNTSTTQLVHAQQALQPSGLFIILSHLQDWLRDNALKNQSKKPSIFIFYLYACLALFKTLTNKCYLIFFFRKKSLCKKRNTTTKKQQKPKWRLSLVVIHPSRQLSMQHLNKIDWLINDRQRAKPVNPVS